jgi:hypothetical protein
MPPRCHRLRAAAQQGAARRSRPKLHAPASRTCCVAQCCIADGRPPYSQRIAIVTHRDGAAIDRDVEPRTAASGIGIDHPAYDEGGYRWVIRVLLPTI